MMLSVQTLFAQNVFRAVVKDGESKEPLIGVSAVLAVSKTAVVSNAEGEIVIENVPDGQQRITFSYIGYESETKTFTFPLSADKPVEIFLEEDEEMLEEITVSSTRGTRTIRDIPTRVEFISSEELGEKGRGSRVISVCSSTRAQESSRSRLPRHLPMRQ